MAAGGTEATWSAVPADLQAVLGAVGSWPTAFPHCCSALPMADTQAPNACASPLLCNDLTLPCSEIYLSANSTSQRASTRKL